MIYIAISLSFLTLIYFIQIIRFYAGLFRLKQGINKKLYSVSIIIPARNEAHNISKCLNSVLTQNYLSEKIEIIIVDDNSTDETVPIIRNFMANYHNLKLVKLANNHTSLSPKKYAISEGIKSSKNELIFTTDADCIAHPDWLNTMVKYFESDVGMVTGLVIFDRQEEQTLFHKVQSLEFLSLIIAGAGSIGSDMPIIGNGANLAYRRSVFEEVDGFKGIDTLKSGDDDLLIQKVARLTTWKIKCAAEKSAIISTKPVPTIKEFLNQRVRWASKGIHYHNTLFILYLIAVYLFYLILFISIPYSFVHFNTFPYPVILLLVKFSVDFLLLCKGTKITGRRDLLKYFLPTELFQLPYILIAGFTGLFGKFNWKGRKSSR